MDDRMRADGAGHGADSSTDTARGAARDLATQSILAAVLELDRAQAVAARLVDAAECRLREVVGEHTAGGAITAAQAEALVAGSGAAGDAPGTATVPGARPAAESGSPASSQTAMASASRHHDDQELGEDQELGDDQEPGDDPLDLQPVDRLLALFATRLPSREEIQPRP